MRLENSICDNVEFDRVDIHLTLSGMNEVLKIAQKFNDLVGQEVDIDVKKHRQKRSKNANDYFYELCGKLADALGTGKDEIHHEMIRRYGQYKRDKEGVIVFHLMPATINYDKEYPERHFKPTGRSEEFNGMKYYWLAEMQPSHEYDSQQFAILLDGTISECQEVGIETLSPDEIKRMEEVYRGGDELRQTEECSQKR